MTTYALYSQPYLDKKCQSYKNIVTINLYPKGPLEKYVRKTQFYPLSPFQQAGPCVSYNKCGLVLTSLNNFCNTNCDDLMIVDEVPNLIAFLMTNGYNVDTSITKMFNASDIRFNTNNQNKLIAFITYKG
jgi:hypothetical protein